MSEFYRYLWTYFRPKLIEYCKDYFMTAATVTVKSAALRIIQDPSDYEYDNDWALSIIGQGKP